MRKSTAVLVVVFHLNPRPIFYPHFYEPGKLVATIEHERTIKKDNFTVDYEKELLTGEQETATTNQLQYDRSHYITLQED